MKKVFMLPKKVWEAAIVMLGVILVWRGMWLMLDTLDRIIFGGSHFITGLIGTLLGFTILYYLDDELEGLSKLS